MCSVSLTNGKYTQYKYTQYKYTQSALDYALNVSRGTLPGRDCNELEKLACNRFLKYYNDPPKNYEYDPKVADRVCKFVERLKHVKGELAGQFIHLEDWQKFIICSCFGFVHLKTRRRMVIESYVEIPRGAGKSTLCSALAIYMLLADHEAGADVYSFATTKEQAKIVFDDAKIMIKNNPDLMNYYKVEALQHAIFQLSTNSKFKALSADANVLDGLNIHFAVIDELHAHKTSAVYDVVKTGIGKRSQPMIFTITTAGTILDGVCMNRHNYVKKLLHNEIEDVSTFGIIYTIDPDDDWRSIESAKKAQPNFGVSVNERTIAMQLKSALNSIQDEINYKTKYLNVWCQADTAFIDIEEYKKCIDYSLKEEDFAGESCLYAVDLATKYDLLAVLKLFARKNEEGEIHYYIFSDFFLPEETIQNSTNINYNDWLRKGYLHSLPGKVNNFLMIEDFIVRNAELFNHVGLVYDPFRAFEFVQIMRMQGFNCIECQNTVKIMSEPMKNIKALIYNKHIHFANNEVLEWCFKNVVCHEDVKGNIFPRKEKNKRDNKIDGAVASIMLMAVALRMNFGELYT